MIESDDGREQYRGKKTARSCGCTPDRIKRLELIGQIEQTGCIPEGCQKNLSLCGASVKWSSRAESESGPAVWLTGMGGHAMESQKRKIKAREFVVDLRSGLDDVALAARYLSHTRSISRAAADSRRLRPNYHRRVELSYFSLKNSRNQGLRRNAESSSGTRPDF